jgi:predicted transcriptional regulator
MYIKLKHIPLSNIYKEFDTIFLEKYKIKKIRDINLGFEKYFKKIKSIEKITFLLKKLFINLKFLKFKKINSRIFFFKKYYRSFIDEQNSFI